MGSIGDCYDNGQMESCWARMHVELLNRKRWNTRLELANAIFEYLEISHNRQRRHSSLGTLSPIEYELRHATNPTREQASRPRETRAHESHHESRGASHHSRRPRWSRSCSLVFVWRLLHCGILSGMAHTLHFALLSLSSLSVGVVALSHARRQRLSMRYTAGWLMLSVVGTAAAALVPLVSPVAAVLSLSSGVVVSAIAIYILIALTLQLSVSLSGATRQTEILAMAFAHSAVPLDQHADGRPLVIVPAWNEAQNVGHVVDSLRSHGHRVVVVDDGSSDNTGDVAARAGAVVLTLPFNLGVGAAIRCGLQYAVRSGAHRVIQCDADGQHPVESVTALVDHAEHTGADLVIGSRFTDGAAPHMDLTRSRRLAMRVLSRVVSRATQSDVSDATSGFRLISEPLLSELAGNMPSYYLGDTFETYVAAGRSGYTVVEVHTPIRERMSGSSSASAWSSIMMIVKAMFLVATRLGIRLSQRPNSTR